MRTTSFFPLASALALLAGVVPSARAEEQTSFQINVRATVDRDFKGLRKEALVEHGKVYAIVSLQQLDNISDDLVKPLNEVNLLKLVKEALASRGFREMAPGTKPDIILTILYGRGWLKNPYLDDVMIDDISGSIPIVTMAGVDGMTHFMRQKEAGYEEKTQRAQTEKLVINITAWKYPEPSGGKKQKPKELWRTTINTDDPDQDLNLLAEKMLKAGAAYFDRELGKEEESVSSVLPDGHVDVGTPTVVEPKKEK